MDTYLAGLAQQDTPDSKTVKNVIETLRRREGIIDYFCKNPGSGGNLPGLEYF